MREEQEEIAKNVRAALQNVNELVKDAYAMGVLVQYDIKRPRHFEPGNPTIFSIVSAEL